MVTLRHALVLGIGVGGLLSANSAVGQVNCTLSFDQNAQIDLANLSRALSDCADDATAPVWSEFIDRGTYQLNYSAPKGSENRRVTGISHVNWAQDIPLKVGTLFGFRARVMIEGASDGETLQIITYFPNGPEGARTPDITTKPLTAGAVEAALFLLGSDALLIPGEWRIELRHGKQIIAAQRFLLAP